MGSESATSPETDWKTQMVDEMQNHIVDDDYYFHADEYLQPSQIRSLISRIATQYKSQKSQQPTIPMSEYDGIEANMDEIYQLDSDDEEFRGSLSIALLMQSLHPWVDSHSDEEEFFGFE